MNILIYPDTLSLGGITTVTEILTEEFKKRGHNVIWLLLNPIFNDNRDYPDNQEVYYLPNSKLHTDENLNYLNNLILKIKPDIIINQWGLFDHVRFIDSISNQSIPRISVLHGNPILNYDTLFKDTIRLRNNSIIEHIKRCGRFIIYPKLKKQFYNWRLNQLKLLQNGGSYIVTLSPSYSNIIKNFLPNYNKITHIYNPGVYENVEISEKEKIIIYVGRLVDSVKRITLLLKIWNRVNHNFPEWKFLIIGDGEDRKKIEREAKKISNVEVLGYQEPKVFYQRASIMLLASTFEGLPMTIIEAMQHGCITIAFDSFPAIHDVISNNKNGLIITNNDIKAFQSALIRVMTDSNLRLSLSKNALQSVTKFERSKIIDKWESLFIRLQEER